jgi:hypothetical protein
MNNLERNKQRVVAFYDLMFNQCRPRVPRDNQGEKSATIKMRMRRGVG